MKKSFLILMAALVLLSGCRRMGEPDIVALGTSDFVSEYAGVDLSENSGKDSAQISSDEHLIEQTSATGEGSEGQIFSSSQISSKEQSSSEQTSNKVQSSSTASNLPVSSAQSSSVGQTPPSAEQNNQKRRSLESKFGIKICYGDEFTFQIEGVQAVKLWDESSIKSSLDMLDTQLSRYPSGFFGDFSRELRICLVTNFSLDYIGLASTMNPGRFDLYLTIKAGAGATLHHELMHMIDFSIMEKEKTLSAFPAWSSYNPYGFVYTGKDSNESPYIFNEKTLYNSYFVTEYSLKSDLEDRADLFATVMAHPGAAQIFTPASPLRQKLLYLTQEIRRLFPSVSKVSKTEWEKFN